MSIEQIAGKVATSLISKLITWGLGDLINNKSNPFEIELSQVIQSTIEEYAELYPLKETNKIPFYTSMVLTDEFFRFRFTSKLDKEVISEAIVKDNRILPPTDEQILKFFEIFNLKIAANKKLQKLNIESNYKEEIFKISESIKEIKNLFLSSLEEVKSQFRSLSIGGELIAEWSKQLDEILGDLKKFRPFTAKERLNNLEERIKYAGFEADKKIFSRLYYMQAQCLAQMEGMDISNTEAELLIKAYTYNNTNSEYKANAALAHYILKDNLTAAKLSDELINEDSNSVIGWILKCFLKEENFKDILQDVPITAKSNRIFKIHLYHWLLHHQYIRTVKEFEELGLAFNIAVTEKVSITFSNKHYSLTKALYLLSKFYEKYNIFSSALYLPDAKEDEEYNYASNILGEIVTSIKGSEVEHLHNNYIFHYYATRFIIESDKSYIYEMERIFKKIENKTSDIVIQMSQAYNSLDEDLETQKAAKILDDFSGPKNELILLFTLINFSILKNQEKVEEYFSKYIDQHNVINKNCLLNLLSLIRQSKLKLTENIQNKIILLIESKALEHESFGSILKIILYIISKHGFASDNDFYNYIKQTEQRINSQDQEIFIVIAFAFVHLEKWDEALVYLESKINFSEPSEAYKLYCKVLYKIEGHKPELLDHLKKWRTNFKVDYELLDMEIYFAQLQKNWKEVVRMGKIGIELFPSSEHFLHLFFVGMGEGQDIEGIRANANLVKGKTFQDEVVGVNISMVLSKASLHEKAFEILYDLAIKKSNKRARQSYVSASMFAPAGLLIEYENVEPGRFVKYSINDKKYVIYISVENQSEFPQNLIINKKVGDNFSFTKSISNTIEFGQVLRICNNYLGLLEELFIEAENPVSTLGIQMVKFDGNSIEALNKSFIDNFGISGSLEKERIEGEFEKYYSGIISFTEITNSVFRRNFIDAYLALSNKHSKMYRAISPALCLNLQITEETEFVLDFTSACLLVELSNKFDLNFSKKFIISPLLKDEVAKRLNEERNSQPKELSVIITKDYVQPTFYPADFKSRRIDTLQKLLDWINKNCMEIAVPERFNFIMELDEEAKRETFFQLIFENKLLSDKSNYILLSNDLYYYRTFGSPLNKVVSPLVFLNNAFLDKRNEINLFLLENNYIGIPIDANILNEELIKWLGNKENRYPICLENLRYSWNPYKIHTNESIKFIKSLYLSAFLNSETRQRIITSVFSNLLVGLPKRILALLPTLIRREFRLLPQHEIEVIQILTQFI